MELKNPKLGTKYIKNKLVTVLRKAEKQYYNDQLNLVKMILEKLAE